MNRLFWIILIVQLDHKLGGSIPLFIGCHPDRSAARLLLDRLGARNSFPIKGIFCSGICLADLKSNSVLIGCDLLKSCDPHLHFVAKKWVGLFII